MSREVLNIHKADGLVFIIHDDKVIDAVFAKGSDDFNGQVIAVNGDGIPSHVLYDWRVSDFAV